MRAASFSAPLLPRGTTSDADFYASLFPVGRLLVAKEGFSARLLLGGAARLADGRLRPALRRPGHALGLGLAATGLIADSGLRLAGGDVRLALQPLRPISHCSPPSSTRQRPSGTGGCGGPAP